MSSSLGPEGIVAARVGDRYQYRAYVERASGAQRRFEQGVLDAHPGEDAFALAGECLACRQPAEFLVDRLWGSRETPGGWLPNWRERLECARCHLNCRQRAVAWALRQAIGGAQQRVWLMERVTAFYAWASEQLGGIVGSEYLGAGRESGAVVDGIRHEDTLAPSFAPGSLDVVVSQDVLEHVADPVVALGAIARVLAPGGLLLLSVPIDDERDHCRARAALRDGQPVHLLPPEWHGDPLNAAGALVFTDFGWQLLDWLRTAGFAEVSLDLVWAPRYGHLGGPHGYFRARLA